MIQLSFDRNADTDSRTAPLSTLSTEAEEYLSMTLIRADEQWPMPWHPPLPTDLDQYTFSRAFELTARSLAETNPVSAEASWKSHLADEAFKKRLADERAAQSAKASGQGQPQRRR
jgi:hypothetical protein